MEPIIWLGVLAVLLVIEGLTTALTTIWFAGGALAAAIAAGIGMGIVPQLLLFFCVSLVLLFFTRPAALKLMRKDTEKTNVEGLLGKKAVVIQKINNLAQTGQVRINDIEWMARTSDDSVTIPVDTVVGSLMEPIIWLGVLAVLLVIEGLTTALTTIWFAGGALAAAIAAGIGMGIVPQLLLFFCVSLVLLFFTRPAALKLMRKDTEKTNVEGLLGKKAVVIQKINNLAQTGQVRINDIEWMARTSDDSVTIPVDTVVIIKAVHGVKLIVEPKEA